VRCISQKLYSSGPQEGKNHSYDIRIITPEHEVPFAGHPILGTTWEIQKDRC
jgi:predicted PhzF superfamily epimerase YddE/YHI9